MAEIIPAIIPTSLKDLTEKVSLMVGHVPLIHIDVTDGSMTGNSNWPYREGVSDWVGIVSEAAGLPHWEDMNFEAHLMTKDPETKVEEWIRAGVERIIVHFEAFASSAEAKAFLDKLRGQFGEEEHLKIDVGLALGFGTPAADAASLFPECDFVHLMSERTLGEQGHAFEEGIFDKIKEVKLADPNKIIAVDGGISADNAARLVEAGVERLVVGSAIFSAPDPLMALEDLNFEIE
jgi:ribulose-phosphate 3-epimerase